MSITDVLDAPIDTAGAGTGPDTGAAAAQETRVLAPEHRVFDLSAGRCAVEVVLAPLGVAVWRVRLQPASIRIVEDGTGGAELTAHVAARPKFASLPGTAGLFMPATDRATILAVSASLPPLGVGAKVRATGVVTRGDDAWPIELSVDVRELDDLHLVAAVRGFVHRRDDLPLPGLRLGVDAAVELRRCA